MHFPFVSTYYKWTGTECENVDSNRAYSFMQEVFLGIRNLLRRTILIPYQLERPGSKFCSGAVVVSCNPFVCPQIIKREQKRDFRDRTRQFTWVDFRFDYLTIRFW